MQLEVLGLIFHDPDIALTDFALSLESLVLGILALRSASTNKPVSNPLALCFIVLGLAAGMGGIFHAFFPQYTGTWSGLAVWNATALLMGLVAILLWMACWTMVFGNYKIRQYELFLFVIYVGYSAYVFFIDNSFETALLFYLQPIIVLMLLMVYLRIRYRTRPLEWGIAGILLSIAAALIQQSQVPLHPQYFDHNSLYHLLQGIGLVFIYRAARYLSSQAYHQRLALRLSNVARARRTQA